MFGGIIMDIIKLYDNYNGPIHGGYTKANMVTIEYYNSCGDSIEIPELNEACFDLYTELLKRDQTEEVVRSIEADQLSYLADTLWCLDGESLKSGLEEEHPLFEMMRNFLVENHLEDKLSSWEKDTYEELLGMYADFNN